MTNQKPSQAEIDEALKWSDKQWSAGTYPSVLAAAYRSSYAQIEALKAESNENYALAIAKDRELSKVNPEWKDICKTLQVRTEKAEAEVAALKEQNQNFRNFIRQDCTSNCSCDYTRPKHDCRPCSARKILAANPETGQENKKENKNEKAG